MKPYYQDEWVTIYHGDCREILPELPKVDLVLTDPPYGINRAQSGHKVISRLGAIYGDDIEFNPTHLLAIATEHIFWGGNYYASYLPNQTRWLMWLKHDHSLFGHRSTSPFELAWTDLGGSCRAFRFIWDGSIKEGEYNLKQHIHPTEKPIELMLWCLSLTNSKTVIDPYMGAGSSVIACKRMNCRCIGIEIEEKYCEIAAKRCSQQVFNLEIP